MTVTTTTFRGMTDGLVDFRRSLVDLLEREYIHTEVARAGDAEA